MCLHAISSLLEKDRRKRIGAAGFETFIDNPFFRPIDFEALERKEIEPIFKPSADKTNFDATYDLEELLLEEAPLEARARRQKPRSALKEDATQEEIRAEQLHQMIETMFHPFNYTLMLPDDDKTIVSLEIDRPFSTSSIDYADSRRAATPSSKLDHNVSAHSYGHTRQMAHEGAPDYSPTRTTPVRTRSSTQSPRQSPSPPLPASSTLQDTGPNSPIEDPHALPIQHYDHSRVDLFSTLSDMEELQQQQHQQQLQQLQQQPPQHQHQHQHHRQPSLPVRGPRKSKSQHRDRERTQREMERDMDREILMELDMADVERERGSPPLMMPSYAPPPGVPGYYGGGGIAGAYNAPQARHSQTKSYAHDRTFESDRRSQQHSTQHSIYQTQEQIQAQMQDNYRSHRNPARTRASTQREDGHQHNSWGDVQHHGGAVLPAPSEVSRSSIATGPTALPSVSSINNEDMGGAKPSGMLGFLNRKRGRDRSPRGEGERADKPREGKPGKEDESVRKPSGKKGKERERGVIGKEGARVVVANG